MPDTLSVIIPALNNAAHIGSTVREVTAAATRHFADYQIILINDGSKDHTGRVAEELAAANPHIDVIHNAEPHGLGGAFRDGLNAARMDYVTRINGKNDIVAEELDRIWSRRGEADLIIPYQTNFRERHIFRRAASHIFTLAVNIGFRIDVRYHNHYVLYPRSLLDSITIRTDSYAFDAEILVKLLRRGHTFVQVGVRDDFTNEGRSTKAFRLRNVLRVLCFFLWTTYDVYLTTRYRQRPRR